MAYKTMQKRNTESKKYSDVDLSLYTVIGLGLQLLSSALSNM